MTYALIIWTLVIAPEGNLPSHDWRFLTQFEGKSAQQMCESAARELDLKRYKCIRIE